MEFKDHFVLTSFKNAQIEFMR